jgi:hypothetical protein
MKSCRPCAVCSSGIERKAMVSIHTKAIAIAAAVAPASSHFFSSAMTPAIEFHTAATPVVIRREIRRRLGRTAETLATVRSSPDSKPPLRVGALAGLGGYLRTRSILKQHLQADIRCSLIHGLAEGDLTPTPECPRRGGGTCHVPRKNAPNLGGLSGYHFRRPVKRSRSLSRTNEPHPSAEKSGQEVVPGSW